MKDLLQFMYHGEVSVKREDLTSFIGTAEVLQIKGLTNKQVGFTYISIIHLLSQCRYVFVHDLVALITLSTFCLLQKEVF